LRHPQAVSSLDELAEGRFQRVLPDRSTPPAGVKRVLLCSGKVYYELLGGRQARQRSDVALVRVEQFYPLADAVLAEALSIYRDGTPVFWVQEEPANMGAAPYFRLRFGPSLLGRFPFQVLSGPAAASPASGSAAATRLEQERLLRQALADQ
jgi:2-oxoglutarate dehydrogenase E1 component